MEILLSLLLLAPGRSIKTINLFRGKCRNILPLYRFSLSIFGLIFISLYFVFPETKAQLVIENVSDVNQLIQNEFVGKGVKVTGVDYSGELIQLGKFKDETGLFPFREGIILSTGLASDVSGQNTSEFSMIPDASTSISGISITDTNLVKFFTQDTFKFYDRSMILFKFRPKGDSIRFKFVFSSEEYPNFAPPNNVNYNDMFGFFIKGPDYPEFKNIALIPGTTTPISITNINIVNNSNYFVPSDSTKDPLYNHVKFNGFTIPIEIKAKVQSCEEYTFLIDISDVGDSLYDSAIFLEANSFSTGGFNVAFEQKEYLNPGSGNSNESFEGCTNSLIFTRTDKDKEEEFDLIIEGTAERNVDYSGLPDKILFPVGVDTVRISFTSIFDDINEPLDGDFESLIVSFVDPTCQNQLITDTLIILNTLPLDLKLIPNSIDVIKTCPNARYHLSGVATGGSGSSNGEYLYTWLNGVKSVSNDPNIDVLILKDTTFILEIHDVCSNIPPVSKSISFQTNYQINLITNKDTTICPGQKVDLVATASNGAFFPDVPSKYQYIWNNGLGEGSTKSVNPIKETTYIVSAVDSCGVISEQKSINIKVLKETGGIDLNYITPDTTVCRDATVLLVVRTVDNPSNFKYQWFDALGTLLANTPTLKVSVLRNNTEFTVYISDSCSEIQRTIKINWFEDLSAEVSPDQTICIGQQTKIGVKVKSGRPPFSFFWVNDILGADSMTVSPKKTTTYALRVADACGQEFRDTVTVFVRDELKLTSPGVAYTCPGEDVTIKVSASGGNGNYTITWDNNLGQGNEKILPPQTKTYRVSVSDDCGSPADTVSITVIVRSAPFMQMSIVPKVVCIDQEAELTYFGQDPPNVKYIWEFSGLKVTPGIGKGPHILKSSIPSKYIVTLQLVYDQCTTSVITDSLRVVDIPKPSFSSNRQRQCLSENEFIFTNSTPDNLNYSYQWNFGSGSVPSTFNGKNPPTIHYNFQGEKSVKLKILSGNCERETELKFNVIDDPAPPNAKGDTICGGYSAFITAIDIQQDYKYYWYDSLSGGKLLGEGVDFTAPVLDSTNIYYLEAENPDGCKSKRTPVRVFVRGAGNLDFETSLTFADIPQAIVEFIPKVKTTEKLFYYWTFGDGGTSTLERPVHNYTTEGEYEITLTTTDSSGCLSSIIKNNYIRIREGTMLVVPNAFSPNDDYVNDEFRIFHRLITEFNIKIFNRAGVMIFESNNPDFIWYGFDPGLSKPYVHPGFVPEGVYIYKIVAKAYNGDPIDLNGTITLIR